MPAMRIPFTWKQPALPTKNIPGASQPPWNLPKGEPREWGGKTDRVQFPHVVRSFVVASDNQSEHWCDLGPGIIPRAQTWCREAQISGEQSRTHLLVKAAELAEFVRNRHTLQILLVAYGLKVPTYQEQIDFVVVLCFETSDMLVNRV